MALTKVNRGGLNTGVTDASDATAITINSSEQVGIGETSPTSALHVKGGAGANIAVQSTAGSHWRIGDGVGSSNGNLAIYDYTNSALRVNVDGDGRTQINANKASGFACELFNDGNNANRYGLHLQCGADDASGTNYAITFYDGDVTSQGNITFSSGTVSYGAFTAYHEISLPDADKANGYPYGTLLEVTNIYYTQKDGSDTERGIRYVTQKSSSQYSRKVLGAYHGDMLAVADSSGTYANNLHQAAVLGDGHIICNNSGGNIKVGDGICASATAGVGQKADKLCMIIGIAQKDITFSGSETVLVPVQYGLQQFTPWTD